MTQPTRPIANSNTHIPTPPAPKAPIPQRIGGFRDAPQTPAHLVPLPMRNIVALHVDNDPLLVSLFGQDLRSYEQYRAFLEEKNYSQLNQFLEPKIRGDGAKWHLVLKDLMAKWHLYKAPGRSLEASNSLLDLLIRLNFKHPTPYILKGAILIAQKSYSMGVTQIRKGVAHAQKQKTIDEILLPIFQTLHKYFKLELLPDFEQPEGKAINDTDIYFICALMTLFDKNFRALEHWLKKAEVGPSNVEPGFACVSMRELVTMIRQSNRIREPLKEIQPPVPPADPSRMYYMAAAAMRQPPVYLPHPVSPQPLASPPPILPAKLSIPGHEFFMQFFGTQENFLTNQILFDQNRFQDQVAFYRELIIEAPLRWPFLLRGLFELFPRRHNIPDILALNLLIELNSANPLPYILRGCFHIKDGQYEQGITLFSEVFSKMPSAQILEDILTLMQKWLQTRTTVQLAPQENQHALWGILALAANQQDLANYHLEQALADPSTEILVQALRLRMGIPVVRQSSAPIPPTSPESLPPPASPATMAAAEALDILSRTAMSLSRMG